MLLNIKKEAKIMPWKSNNIWFAKVRDKKKVVLKLNPKIEDKPGIYLIWRVDPFTNVHVCYVGQAKKILERLAKHLLQYQKIDNSIRKHGLYDKEKNPGGYMFSCIQECEPQFLDEFEKICINNYIKEGWVLENISGGGQGERADDIHERKASKGYLDGLKQGYKNCLRDVKEFFDKYLDYVIKEPRLTAKKKPVVIKQKKYDEFKSMLEEIK